MTFVVQLVRALRTQPELHQRVLSLRGFSVAEVDLKALQAFFAGALLVATQKLTLGCVFLLDLSGCWISLLHTLVGDHQ